MIHHRTCQGCGAKFTTIRSRQRYCAEHKAPRWYHTDAAKRALKMAQAMGYRAKLATSGRSAVLVIEEGGAQAVTRGGFTLRETTDGYVVSAPENDE